MSEQRVGWKVGLFVAIGLILVAGLILRFSKGNWLFQGTYNITLKTSNVGGIVKDAQALMAGVPVGSVQSVQLAKDGRSVLIHLAVKKGVVIHGDALFTIQQSGFLGDQYIAITPRANKKPPLQNGAEVKCEQPFNLQDAARSAADFIRLGDGTLTNLNNALNKFNEKILAESNLTSISVAFSNIRLLSQRALATFDRLDNIIGTNAPHIAVSVSNLAALTKRLNLIAESAQGVLTTNRITVRDTLENLNSASASASNLLAGWKAGRGTLGALLRDDKLRDQLAQTMANLTTASSNIARFGLLYKPKQPKPPLTNRLNSPKAYIWNQ